MSVPRPAAAAIVLRGSSAPDVLLARRNDTLRFMGGHHVFPGGSVDPSDHALAAAFWQRTDDEAVAMVAAAREVFEETGLLLAEGTAPPEAERDQAREDLHRSACTFADVLSRFGLRLDAARFIPAGYWVTPSFSPIRFATRFFIYRYNDAFDGVCCGGEITALDWMTPASARAAWRSGTLRLSVPVAYALHCLARFGYPAALLPMRDLCGREPGEAMRFEMRCGIALYPFKTATLPPATHTNAVLIGEDELILIDPGSDDPGELALLDQQLEMALGAGGWLQAVLLTHAHPDHIGGVEHVARRYGVPVWAHEAAADRLTVPLDRTIAHGDLLEVAGEPPWRLRAIHTPGHDPAHLAFLEESTGTLIGGDIIANPGTIVISLEHGGDMDAYLRSIDSLIDEEFGVLIPAHGMPMGKPKERLMELKAHRLAREARVQTAWNEGARTEDDLLALVYADTAAESWPLARHSLRAHAKRLGLHLEEPET